MFLKTLRYTFVCIMLSFPVAYAQVTTASLGGTVSANEDGSPLVGATVVATHLPSGTNYGAVTRSDGRFNLTNIRIGGPYVVRVSYTGYESVKLENINLTLGQNPDIKFSMKEQVAGLEEAVVVADRGIDRTGAETAVSEAQLEALPTIKRSFQDFARLTPQGEGFSFSGRNRLFNNLTIDGSIFNNPFGLDAATPGGQANAQPISLDAIEQILVQVAPFDVRQSGFTGASINAVTKSGTNNYTGTLYSYFRNENLIGEKVGDIQITNPNLSYNQSGVSFGGPIVKNKVFFFGSAEVERREDPGSTYLAYRSGLNASDPNVATVTAADLDLVRATLLSRYNYETGAYENYTHQTSSNKYSAKIDVNLNTNHSLNFVYKGLRSFRDVLPNPAISVTGRGPNRETIPFEYNSYIINNNLNSYVAELNSRFGTNISNQFQVGLTTFRDFRDSKSKAFPSVDILNNGRNYISFGLERFSINNVLDQDVLQATNNLTVYRGKNIITAGLSWEQFKFNNSFNLFYYPGVTFNSMADFVAATTPGSGTYVDFNAQVTAANATPFRADKTNFGQLGAYVQNEMRVSDNLKLTLGIRADKPFYLNSLAAQSNIESLTFYKPDGTAVTGIKVNEYPNAKPLISPRFGFNYDVKGDRSSVIRGGTGLFTGRIPFVWLGNQSANNDLRPGYTFQINTTGSDFKFPQVWRTNIAFDQNLPGDLKASVDFIYGKDINAVVHRNYNMRVPTGTADGANNGGDERPIFNAGQDRVNIAPSGSFLDAGLIVLENTNEGNHFSITTSLAKSVGNLTANVAYSYGVSKDITSNPGEIAANAFQTLPNAGNPNAPSLSYADHDLKHRLIGALSYSKAFKSNMETNFGLFFSRVQGGPGEVIGEVGGRYSYTYAGDMNRDGISGNDLMYIPASASEIILVPMAGDSRTTTQLWNDLNAFIEQDPYLSANRGKIAERNGAILPAFGQIDLKIAQDVMFKKHKLQLSFDVLNLGNLLNSDWGVRSNVNTRTPLTFAGYNAQGEPTFNFPLYGGQPLSSTFGKETTIRSRWQAQFGIRYVFK